MFLFQAQVAFFTFQKYKFRPPFSLFLLLRNSCKNIPKASDWIEWRPRKAAQGETSGLDNNAFLAIKSKNLGKYYKMSFVIQAILHWKVLFDLQFNHCISKAPATWHIWLDKREGLYNSPLSRTQFNHICRSWTIIEKCLCTFVPPGIPLSNPVTIT